MDLSRPQTRNPDEWLAAAPDFSRPIVADFREWVFRTAPDLTESIKWNILCFSGRKLVCSLSAWKKHVGFIFFRGTELPDPAGLFDEAGEGNVNMRSIRLTSLQGVNRRHLATLLLAAVSLDEQPAIPPAPKVRREPWPMPDFFAEALKRDRKATAGYQSLSPSGQREYLVWLSTAKREATRAQRLAQTLAALAAGHRWAQRKQA